MRVQSFRIQGSGFGIFGLGFRVYLLVFLDEDPTWTNSSRMRWSSIRQNLVGVGVQGLGSEV